MIDRENVQEDNTDYQQFIRELPVAVYSCDPKGRILSYNKAATELWGCEPELEKDIWCGTKKIYKADGTPLSFNASPMAMAVKTGKAISGEKFIIERPNGEWRQVLAHPTPTINSSGNVTGSVNVLIDITKHDEKEPGKGQLGRVLEESLNEIYMFDSKTLNFNYVNKGGLTNIGYTMAEMADMTSIDIIPEFTLQSFNELIDPLRKKEKGKIVFETFHKRKNGSLYPVEVHLQLVHESEVFIAIKLDITDRKKVEEERGHLMHVLEESLNEIYMFNPDTFEFTFVNKGALRNIGYSMKDMIHMTPLDIKPEFNPQTFEEMVEPLRKKEKEKIVFETVHKRMDGSLYDVEVHLQLVKDVSSPVFLAIILDITDRKNVEKEILQLNENLEKKVEERTASLMSYQKQLRSLAFQLTKTKEHERKQLAGFMHDNLGQVLAIGKMELDRVKNDEIPEHLNSNIERVSDVIDDAIRYTRELMSDLKPAPAASDEDLIANISWAAQKMKKYGLEVDIRDDEQPKPLTEEVRNLITQSVRELLFNVVKHAEVKKAEVTIKRINDYVQVTVKDHGKGFVAKKKKQGITKKNGFGLFNLQEQMEWLKSSMEIFTNPGEGTNVKLTFPLNLNAIEQQLNKDGETDKLKMVISPNQSTSNSNIKVLIVDDHEMMRKGLRKMIEEQEGLEVSDEASNGKEAVEIAEKHPPDIIIMDVNMPVMGGIEATRQIMLKKLPVRIIGLSFHHNQEVAQAILDAGASIYLTKSEVFEALCATVRSEARILKNGSG